MRHNVNTKHDAAGRFFFPVLACSIIFFSQVFVLCPIEAGARNNKKAEQKAEEPAAPEKETQDAGKTGDAAKTAAGEESKNLQMKDYKEDDFKPQVEEESYAWMIIKTILVLGFLVGGFYYFFRFVTKKTGINLLGTEAVHVIAVVPLGQNKYLQIVDIPGKLLILGVSDSGISLVSEVTEKEAVDRIRMLSSRTPPPSGGGFHEYLTMQIGKFISRLSERKGRGDHHVESSVDFSYLRQQKRRLKDLNGSEDE